MSQDSYLELILSDELHFILSLVESVLVSASQIFLECLVYFFMAFFLLVLPF